MSEIDEKMDEELEKFFSFNAKSEELPSHSSGYIFCRDGTCGKGFYTSDKPPK